MICNSCGKTGIATMERDGVATTVCGSCLDLQLLRPGFSRLVTAMARPASPTTKCPYCSRTEAEVTDTGLVGCPLCYEVMPKALLNRLGARLHSEPARYAS